MKSYNHGRIFKTSGELITFSIFDIAITFRLAEVNDVSEGGAVDAWNKLLSIESRVGSGGEEMLLYHGIFMDI